MKKLIVAAVAVSAALAASPASATDQAPGRKLEVAPYVGRFIPTGEQRDLLHEAFLYGLALSYDVHPYVAVVGSFALSDVEARGIDTNDVNLFQYDLGLQGQYAFELRSGVALKPFVGAGIGARTYDVADDGETDLAGYFAAGGEVQYRDGAVGLTVRDYLSDFDGIGREEDSSLRNDLAVFLSVAARF